MIDAVWLEILHRIPTDYYDCLSFITVTGAELIVQQIFKLERDFVVVRARTSGTGDLGRTILIPYAQVDFIAFNKKMSEEDVLKIFAEPMANIPLQQPMAYQPMPYAAPSSGVIPQAPSPQPKPAPAPTPAASEPTIEEAEPAEPAEPAVTQKPGQISKTILLARLRERLAEKSR